MKGNETKVSKKKTTKMIVDKEMRERVEEVRNGLFEMFSWVKSPQGAKYWSDVVVELDKILDLYDEPESDNLNLEEIKKALEGIYNGFTWKDTPQGAKYWSEVIDNLEELLRKARNDKEDGDDEDDD